MQAGKTRDHVFFFPSFLFPFFFFFLLVEVVGGMGIGVHSVRKRKGCVSSAGDSPGRPGPRPYVCTHIGVRSVPGYKWAQTCCNKMYW